MAGGVESKKAIYAALFGNLAIAISKLFAALFTGSTSMWAETYHSFSDTFNQVLLLLGLKASKKEANEKYPFGFGKEQFFWSFVCLRLLDNPEILDVVLSTAPSFFLPNSAHTHSPLQLFCIFFF